MLKLGCAFVKSLIQTLYGERVKRILVSIAVVLPLLILELWNRLSLVRAKADMYALPDCRSSLEAVPSPGAKGVRRRAVARG